MNFSSFYIKLASCFLKFSNIYIRFTSFSFKSCELLFITPNFYIKILRDFFLLQLSSIYLGLIHLIDAFLLGNYILPILFFPFLFLSFLILFLAFSFEICNLFPYICKLPHEIFDLLSEVCELHKICELPFLTLSKLLLEFFEYLSQICELILEICELSFNFFASFYLKTRASICNCKLLCKICEGCVLVSKLSSSYFIIVCFQSNIQDIKCFRSILSLVKNSSSSNTHL